MVPSARDAGDSETGSGTASRPRAASLPDARATRPTATSKVRPQGRDQLGTGGAPPTVSILGPNTDAPGASILTVLTARQVPANGQVRFELAAGRQAGQCVGDQWRHAGGTSQTCWVVLPAAPGAAQITASAQVADSRGEMRRTATETAVVTTKGPSTESVPETERDRILRCGNSTDRVWLTFDDGFIRESTMDSMLATLERANVKARFFPTGQWARSHPDWVSKLRRAGHQIGNHTSTHEWLNTLDDAQLRRQISEGPESDEPRLLRPGYGSGAFSAKVNQTARSLGQQVCYWTVETRDWDGTPAARLISSVVDGSEWTPPLRPGGVVLMHMTGKHTAEALPGLIAAIRAKGMELEPLR